MQDHDVGEAVGGGGGGLAEAGAFDFGHDAGGVVADGAGEAVVLVGTVMYIVSRCYFRVLREGEGIHTH